MKISKAILKRARVELARAGGLARAKKLSAEELSVIGKKGGRPRKVKKEQIEGGAQ